MAEGNQRTETSNQSQDMNKAKPQKESLEDLLTTLSSQIRSSDWLEQNTPEKFALENPEVAQAFKEAAEKSSTKQSTGDNG
ncbi:1-aminocyclopropane-1-carboxylate synthase homolog [Elysia marginata]|uniref:1-aminocyclopropane-1-carboxylate synthase homolog n=1 Tax=Elysia marginata TaxID=1093978 RepID=A0AAV4H9D0_9GAST|nr:1-aminocyclopropane-1-carboxylate synthase homolog [Elysia marginata]